MTMIQGVTRRSREAEAIATWHEVDSGFWVASADGVFLGSIERLARGRFLARDAIHRIVGEYAGLAHARNAIALRTHTE